MKISVITVCLNAANCIEETFLSLFNQSSKEWELIVFDGLSSDNTVDIINKYKDRITVFKSQKDKGIYDAMNSALKCASGDYLLFLNAGDTLVDNYVFEKTIPLLEKNNPDIAFGYTRYSQTGEIEKHKNWQNKFFFAANCFCHQCMFYKKELFEKTLYDTSFKIYADWDFTVKCVKNYSAKVLPLGFCVSNYSYGGISSKKENFKTIRKERTKIQKTYFPLLYPLLAFDNFCTKNLNTIWRPLKKVLNKLLRVLKL